MHDDNHVVRTKDSCVYSSGRMALLAGWLGACASSFESLNRPISSSLLQVAGRAGIKYILPCSFAGLIFGGSTCILDSVRGKDGNKQVTNGLLGGLIAGMVVGAKAPNPYKSLTLGLSLAGLGFFARLAATGVLENDEDPKQRLEYLTNTIDMKEVSRLAVVAQQSQ